MASLLPTPRNLVTSIISSLQPDDNAQLPTGSSNPLLSTTTSSHIRKSLLTLHVLFPNELLPALDVLDRGLVTRLILRPSNEPGYESLATDATNATDVGRTEVYMVRSGRDTTDWRTRGRHSSATHQNFQSYEVRLEAWSCSCPAFAFAAFPANTYEASTIAAVEQPHSRNGRDAERDDRSWKFGGLTLGCDMPVCKHLLACTLVEHSPLFAGFVEDRVVIVEELAGWAAGWGD